MQKTLQSAAKVLKVESTCGTFLVTERNPTTGRVQQHFESYDQSGNVVRVHPKMIDGIPVSSPHFPPTGKELKK